jgi:outer membrane protein
LWFAGAGFMLAAACLPAQTPPAAAQPQRLTLRQAEELAAKNHPRVSIGLLMALAANQVTTEVRAAYFPVVTGSLTGAGALNNSRITAGFLNDPTILNRVAGGFMVNQLVTDFGRTSNLAESARFGARAEDQRAQATRAEILLQADRAYFATLRSSAVLTVAEQTVSARQIVADQVTALAQSKLKSDLDVSFANVNLSEARLLLIDAQNQLRAAFAELSAALGSRDDQAYNLAEEPMPSAPATELAPLVDRALRDRPELAGARLHHDQAVAFASAERDLKLPTVSAVGAAGVAPVHADTLSERYSALGVNVNIPVFNGHLFTARRTEAELRAQAAEQGVRNLENAITRDVRVAWLNENTAYQRLSVTDELLRQATLSQDLAQARYDLGLGSIVELSQAQLNKTSAQITSAEARYDYQIQNSVLAYQTGALR